ncbi:MAG: hypothetical protein PHD48_08340, partial [Alphaproteobacteria bacterium]|nr:hypothetical protein [Alphaproteobacteria bacterium]
MGEKSLQPESRLVYIKKTNKKWDCKNTLFACFYPSDFGPLALRAKRIRFVRIIAYLPPSGI